MHSIIHESILSVFVLHGVWPLSVSCSFPARGYNNCQPFLLANHLDWKKPESSNHSSHRPVKTPPSDIVPPTGIPPPLHGKVLWHIFSSPALTHKQSILLVNTQQIIVGDFSAGVCCVSNDFFFFLFVGTYSLLFCCLYVVWQEMTSLIKWLYSHQSVLAHRRE